MAVVRQGGKPAVTHYEMVDAIDGVSVVRLLLETGRTHQIRVHMSHIGHPLVGDQVYTNKSGLHQLSLPPDMAARCAAFPRQALHACRLALVHPRTGTVCEWRVSLPGDMQILLDEIGMIVTGDES